MSSLSQILLDSGITYDIEDTQARTDIEDLKLGVTGAMHYAGVTTTILTDNAAIAPIIINGENYVPRAGDVVIYDQKEYVWNGSVWNEFGSTGSLKALAFKNNASGNFTPQGSVSAPDITITPNTNVVNSISNVGTLPSLTMTVTNERLIIGWDAGTLPTKGVDQTVVTGISSVVSTQPSFIGTQGSVTVS